MASNSASGITVDRGSISRMISEAVDYEGRLYDALWTVTDTAAKKMEEWAKHNAIWNDQTTNARQGLRGDAWWENAHTLVCSMSHTMEYGIWLELAKEKKYAILEQSINQHKDELIEAWKTLVGE